VAVLLSGGWVGGFLAVPLSILLFPDGRPGAGWRWPLRVYIAVMAALIAATQVLAASDLRLRAPVDESGNLAGLGHPSGWFAPFFYAGFLSCFVLCVVSVVSQVVRYRRASGERRQQVRWLGAAAALCVVFLLATTLWSNAPGVVGDLLFPLGLTALPVGIGVGILRYRLYEIDRLISRTLSYAILTALLVGTFIGLIALTTDALALSGRVGVAASTLAAAALFNPLRVRIQRLVDRRFNRAHYNAEATVAAFTARLRDAVEIDVISSDLLDAVGRAVQPTHASVWIKP
jgi:MFS family permease